MQKRAKEMRADGEVRERWGEEIGERTFHFALDIVALFRMLEGPFAVQTIGRQVFRSGTSIGANVQEAKGGQTRRDFIAKMSIAQKEANETLYWLSLLKESGLFVDAQVDVLILEVGQLRKILSAIVVKAKAHEEEERFRNRRTHGVS
jgi:four helix bundle protein